MQFQYVIESISKNPWLVIISFVLTVLSIVMAIVFYLKSRKYKKVKVVHRTINLLRKNSEKIDGLEIRYQGLNTPNISITKIAFWNCGNETINGSDITISSPLIIRSRNGVNLLESKIIYTKNESNELRLNEIENGKQVALQFDYIDKNEGCVIQILHTGETSYDIELVGTIKSIGKIDSNKRISRTDRLIAIAFNKDYFTAHNAGIFCIAFFVVILFLAIKLIVTSNNLEVSHYLSLAIGTFTYLVLGIRLLKKRVPKGFEVFEETI